MSINCFQLNLSIRKCKKNDLTIKDDPFFTEINYVYLQYVFNRTIICGFLTNYDLFLYRWCLSVTKQGKSMINRNFLIFRRRKKTEVFLSQKKDTLMINFISFSSIFHILLLFKLVLIILYVKEKVIYLSIQKLTKSFSMDTAMRQTMI